MSDDGLARAFLLERFQDFLTLEQGASPLGIELLVPLSAIGGDPTQWRYVVNAGNIGEVVPEHAESELVAAGTIGATTMKSSGKGRRKRPTA